VGKTLPFWLAYGRAIAIFFSVLMTLDWLDYALWGGWLEWRVILAVAATLPVMGFLISVGIAWWCLGQPRRRWERTAGMGNPRK